MRFPSSAGSESISTVCVRVGDSWLTVFGDTHVATGDVVMTADATNSLRVLSIWGVAVSLCVELHGEDKAVE